MTWKFCNRPRTKSAPPASSLVALGAIVVGWAAGAVNAQLPRDPTPTPATSRPKSGYVRFWNMLPPPPGAPAGVGALEIMLSENQPLTTAPPGNFYAGYCSLPPGAYNFTIRKVGDVEHPLKRLPLPLRGDQFVTILASLKDGQPNVEIIDDTIDPQTPPDAPAQLTVRQYMPGVKMSVMADKHINSGDLNFGDVTVMSDLPTRVVPLDMRGMVRGTPKTWNLDADFSRTKRATLLVVADPYGRFRPRISVDGRLGDGVTDSPPQTPNPGAPRNPSPLPNSAPILPR